MKKPRKPKALKMPKKPKQSAPLYSWERYEDKCKEVHKKNADKMKEYTAAIHKIESDKKRKAAIIKKYA
jgi:hypothetical protein